MKTKSKSSKAQTKKPKLRSGIGRPSGVWRLVPVPASVRASVNLANGLPAPNNTSETMLDDLDAINRACPLPPNHKPLGIDLADRKQVRDALIARQTKKRK